MTRQARKLSGLGTYQGVWYRHASAVTASGPLFWSNTIVVAYEKMIRRTDPMIKSKRFELKGESLRKKY
jgi:hypothetical protein